MKTSAKIRERAKQQYYQSKDGKYHVYLLPKENYVGVTQSTTYRWNRHKNHYNRDIEGARVLYSTSVKADAYELEDLLHELGYKGRSTSTFKKGHKLSAKAKKRQYLASITAVEQYTLNGKLLNTYSSIDEAFKDNGMKTGSGISNCCAGRIKSCYGYVWKYAK